MAEKKKFLRVQKILVIRDGSPSESNENKKSNFFMRFLSSDVIIIPILSIVIYGYSYVMEYNYLRAFNIPYIFLSIQLPNIGLVLLHLATMYLMYIPMGFLILLILNFWKRSGKEWSLIVLFSNVVSTTIYSSMIDANRTNMAETIGYAMPFSFFLGLIITIPIYVLLHIDLPKIVNQKIFLLLESKKKNLQTEMGTVDQKLLKLLPVLFRFWDYEYKLVIKILNWSFLKPLLLLYILLLLTDTFMVIGKNNAKDQAGFYVANTKPECVVLYQTQEYYLCSSFDRSRKEVGNDVQVLYYRENQNIKLNIEDVGPLHLKPTPTKTPKPTMTPAITKTLLPTSIPYP